MFGDIERKIFSIGIMVSTAEQSKKATDSVRLYFTVGDLHVHTMYIIGPHKLLSHSDCINAGGQWSHTRQPYRQYTIIRTALPNEWGVVMDAQEVPDPSHISTVF